ncbi:hypothetical protein [Evansella tamaricis]|uniref:Uncharacterized protein n=1 Tax=Evansella tamaricis TaxID=2069301 RepID=A0ABS6JIC7_9BACI|nr:hypothetical protein [Evansella tamaricis]MBU9713432.1 hypothetical protein [Evansella tamaricis]
MFSDLNKRLEVVKEKQRRQHKWKGHLHTVESYLLEEQQKADMLLDQLKKEKQDVERLESFSLTNIFYSITGKKLEKLDEEKQEVLSAKLKYQEAMDTVEDLKKEITEYQKLLKTVEDADIEYEEILQDKEVLIQDTQSYWSRELYDLAERGAELRSAIKEYDEAIQAGEVASNGLEEAIKSLESASGWSTFDMFGGGMLTTAIKHSHLDSAKDAIHRAQNKLRQFQQELLDVESQLDVNLEVGNFLTFADYFFDGLIVDWMVHGKINDSLTQALEMKNNVTSILYRIKEDERDLIKKLNETESRRIELLESAT